METQKPKPGDKSAGRQSKPGDKAHTATQHKPDDKKQSGPTTKK